MTISLAMMFGRFGALIGNVVFPYLLQTGCLPPFLLIGLIQFGKLKQIDELHNPFIFLIPKIQLVVSCASFFRKPTKLYNDMESATEKNILNLFLL